MKNILYFLLTSVVLFSVDITPAVQQTPQQPLTQLYSEYNISRPTNPDQLVDTLLDKYHLSRKKIPFSYTYKTEIYSELMDESCALPDAFEKIAKTLNTSLNKSFFFSDIGLLNNPLKVRQAQLKKKKGSNERVSLLTARTSDGIEIQGTHYNRGSNTLIVVGAGFTNEREKMAPFADMFDCDMLFFDYRGHGAQKERFFQPSTWKSVTKRLFGVDHRTVRLGLAEEKDVTAIVTRAKREKQYDQVIGLGVCYSAMIFTKTQAMYPGTFDKLILDGTWKSLGETTQRLARDPRLIINPQEGGWSDSFVARSKTLRKLLLRTAERLFSVEFNTLSVLDYTPHLGQTPILFVHSRKDLLVGNDEFETIWASTSSRQKTAVLTSNPHVRNHLKEKEVYRELCLAFITHSHEAFTQLITNPETFINHKAAQLRLLTKSLTTS